MNQNTNAIVGASSRDGTAACLCFNLRKAARVVTQLYDEALRPSGLRATQFSLLATVRALEPVTLARLADAMVMDRTTLTRNMRPLEREGLVTLRVGSDRRERDAALTEQGRGVLATAAQHWRAAQDRAALRLGRERWAAVLADLAVVTSVLAENPPKSATGPGET